MSDSSNPPSKPPSGPDQSSQPPPSLFHTLPPAPKDPAMTVRAPAVIGGAGEAQVELLIPYIPSGPLLTIPAAPTPESIAVSTGQDRDSLLERLRERAKKLTPERVDELFRSCL